MTVMCHDFHSPLLPMSIVSEFRDLPLPGTLAIFATGLVTHGKLQKTLRKACTHLVEKASLERGERITCLACKGQQRLMERT